MTKEWVIPDQNQSDFASKMLKGRELETESGYTQLSDLPEESLFANIDVVTDRIHQAMYNNEPLVIFGHDDPDGVTSTYILYRFLNSCGYQKHHYYIPNRQIEPHGIQKGFIEHVKQNGYKLVITVDNGISSYEGVEELKAMGCDVIIVDHHLIQLDTLPQAFAILNPQLSTCQYPFKALAGVGVVMMLIRYLGKYLEHPIDPSYYFWTAVGSLADKVPLVGVNRTLLRHAMESLSSFKDNTIDFLMRNHPRINSKMDAFNFISYTAKLIANGREADGQHTAIRFMLQLSDDKVMLFEDLERQKQAWEGDLNRVFRYVDTLTQDFQGTSFIFYDDDDLIPYSLLGTAASYVVNQFCIPAILLKMHNGKIVCEGRCCDGFNIVNAFSACKEFLIQYGGHPKAAGFIMIPENYDAFIECYNDYLSTTWSKDSLHRVIVADLSMNLEDLSYSNWEQYESLLPFGQKNPEPLIHIRKTTHRDIVNHFNLDTSINSLPRDKEIELLIHWKSPNTLKVVDFREV